MKRVRANSIPLPPRSRAGHHEERWYPSIGPLLSPHNAHLEVLAIESASCVCKDNPCFSLFYCAMYIALPGVWSEEPFISVPIPNGPIKVPVQAATATKRPP